MNQRSGTNKRSPRGKSANRGGRARRPFVIDFHAHVIIPEVAAFARPYTVAAASDAAPKGLSGADKERILSGNAARMLGLSI